MPTKLIKIKKSSLILIPLLAILISGCTNNLNALSPPKIELSTTSFDLGDINPKEGIITKTFFVKNTGRSLLKITSVSTSCGCTEAEVDSKEILPGEQTRLIVNYDPSVHSGLTGKIKRIIYIKSNDPINKEVELELIGNSLPSSKTQEERP